MTNYESPNITINVSELVVTDDIAGVEVFISIDGTDHYIGKAGSRRDPQDRVDHEIALKLALGRALRTAGRGILAEAQKKVRQADKFRKSQEAASLKAREYKNRPPAFLQDLNRDDDSYNEDCPCCDENYYGEDDFYEDLTYYDGNGQTEETYNF